MSDLSFPVELVTPEGQLFTGFADFVAIPATRGELGFLHHRAPIMASLGSGELRIHDADGGAVNRYAVNGGFAGTDGEKLVVLASRAQRLDAYDLASLKVRREELEARLAEHLAAEGLADEDEPNVEIPYLRDELAWVVLVTRLVRWANM